MGAMVLLCDGGEWIELTDQDAARLLSLARALAGLDEDSDEGEAVRGVVDAAARRGEQWARESADPWPL